MYRKVALTAHVFENAWSSVVTTCVDIGVFSGSGKIQTSRMPAGELGGSEEKLFGYTGAPAWPNSHVAEKNCGSSLRL